MVQVSARLPGPRSITDQVRFAQEVVRDPHAALLNFAATYGPVAQVGYRRYRYVMVFGVEANEYVLHGNAANFRWKEAFWPLEPLVGENALIVSDGVDHKRRKDIVLPAFHRRRISTYFDVMTEQTRHVLDTWQTGQSVNAYDGLRLVIRKTVLECLFGNAFGLQQAGFVEYLELILNYVNRTPLQRLDNELFPPYRKVVRARKQMDAIISREIARRRNSASTSEDILGWLIEAQDSDGPDLNDSEVRDLVIGIIAAAYDTTAAVMGWIAMRLANDPTLKTQIRNEVNSATSGEAMTVDDLPALKLTGGVVNEVLRLHPPAVVSVRNIVSPFPLHGYIVPSGRFLMYSPYVSHMDPEQFPNPSSFMPTRWIEGHADSHPYHSYAYLPFGGGSRRCLGFAFALQQLTVMTAMLASVDFEPGYASNPKPTGIMSMAPQGGVPLRIL